MRCSNCNSEVKKGDKKCTKCGATLIWNNELDNGKKKAVSKNPISIAFIVATAALFFFFLFISLISAAVAHSFNYAQAISVTFIVFASIYTIAFFFLILVNKRINKGRTKNFLIALGVAMALLVIFSTLLPVSRNPYQSASGFFKEKSYEEAIKYYQIVIYENKNPEQVIEAGEKIKEAQGFIKEANGYMGKGDQYYNNSQFELALAEYEAAKTIYPYSPGLDEKISDCNIKVKEKRAAEAQKVEEIEILLNQGKSHFQAKRYTEALDKYNQVLKLEATNKEAKDSISEIETIIDEVEKLLAEGDDLIKNEKYSSALSKYEDAEEIYPDHPEVAGKIETTKLKLSEQIKLAKESEPEEEIVEEPEEEVTEEAVEEPEEGEEDPNTTETSPGETDSATLGEKIEYIVISLLGEETNNDLPTIVDIEIASLTGEEGPEGNTAFIILNGNDNLTTNMTKVGMWIDAIKLFKEFFKIEEITRVDLKWQLPLVDTYGNTKVGVVMEIMLTRETAEKINWDNFLFQNLPKVADIYQEHPAFSN